MDSCSPSGGHRINLSYAIDQASRSSNQDPIVGEASSSSNPVPSDNGSSLVRQLVWDYCQVKSIVAEIPLKILMERAIGLAKVDLAVKRLDPNGLKLLIALDLGVREGKIVLSETIDIFEFLTQGQLIAAAELAVNRDAIRELYQRAGKLGNPLANLRLSIEFESIDPKRSFLYCLLASQKSNVEALYRIGSYHERGFGTLPDLQKAIDAYEKGADCGGDRANFIRFLERNSEDPRAAFKIFQIYKTGKYSIPINWDKALKAFDVVVNDIAYVRSIPNFTKLDQEAVTMMDQLHKLLLLNEKYKDTCQSTQKRVLELLSFLNEYKASDVNKKELEEATNAVKSQIKEFAEDPEIRDEIERLYQQKLLDFDYVIKSLSKEFEEVQELICTQLEETKKNVESPHYLNDHMKNQGGVEFFTALISSYETIRASASTPAALKESFGKIHSNNLATVRQVGQKLMGQLQAEKSKIVARHQKLREIQEKKESGFNELLQKLEQLLGESALYQEQIAGSFNNITQKWNLLQIVPEEENSIDQIEDHKNKLLKELEALSIESRLKSSDLLSQQAQMKAQESEKKLSQVQSQSNQVESKQHRKDQEEIESLKKQLHETQRRVEQAEIKLNQQLEQQKIVNERNLEKLSQKIDHLRADNQELKMMVQAIPITTSIEILVKRIDRRIDDLTDQGIKEVKQFKLKKLPKTLSGTVIKEILENLNYEEVMGKGSHRHFVGDDESMGLSVHNLGDVPDPAQVQQALNFLLSELLSCNGGK